jgi:WD40 repeat protein
MVSADFAGCVKLWRAGVVGQELGALLGHTGGVKTMCYTANGKALITASHDASLRTWDATDVAMESANPPPHAAAVTSISFAPDGSWFVTTSRDGYARVSETKSNELKFFMKHENDDGRLAPVTCSAVDRLGIRIYTGAVDGYVRVWNAFAGVGGNNGSLMTKFSFHHSAISGLYLTENILFAASWDKSIKEIGTTSFKVSRSHKFDAAEITCITGPKDGGQPYIGFMDGTVAVAEQRKAKSNAIQAHTWVNCIAVNGAGNVASGGDGYLYLHDVNDGLSGLQTEIEDDFFRDGRPARVNGVSFIDDNTLAVACSDGTLRIMKPEGLETAAWFHATAPLTSINVSKTSRTLICVGDVLGNVYLVEHREGESGHVLMPPEVMSEEGVEDTTPHPAQQHVDPFEDSASEYSEASRSDVTGTDQCDSTSVTTSASRASEAVTQYFSRMPRGLSVAERKAFVKNQHQMLISAMRTYNTSAESRAFVGMYSAQQTKMASTLANMGMM